MFRVVSPPVINSSYHCIYSIWHYWDRYYYLSWASHSSNGFREPGPSWSCSQAVSKPVCHIPLLCVQWKTPDDGQRNCPKHVEFYSKNKSEKLVHLFGFIIRICHDARSSECQMCSMYLGVTFEGQYQTPTWRYGYFHFASDLQN